MTTQPTYDLTVIIPFGIIAGLCLWSIFWNCVIFNMPIDGWGIALGLIGTLSLGGVFNYIIGVWKLRRNFVWETLKNG